MARAFREETRRDGIACIADMRCPSTRWASSRGYDCESDRCCRTSRYRPATDAFAVTCRGDADQHLAETSGRTDPPDAPDSSPKRRRGHPYRHELVIDRA